MHYFSILLFFVLMVRGAFAEPSPPRPLQSLSNPEISLAGLFSASYFSDQDGLNFGAHDPQETGFTLQNLELTLGANVDPFFRADTNLIFGLERGDSTLEVEEAYLTTLSLPFGLQWIGGQFFTRFGRVNAQHPHFWDFADQPVIHNRILGPDGLRNLGMQVSWLAPLPIYVEVLGSIQNATGGTAISFLYEGGESIGGYVIQERAVRNFGDFLYLGRLKTAWNPSDRLEMVIGSSSLLGPNGTGEDARTRIYGADIYAKWSPIETRRGFPFLSLQVEGLWRHYEISRTVAQTTEFRDKELRDRGYSTQILWGFFPRWVAGIRVDHAQGGDRSSPLHDRRWRVAQNLTFYPTEFSKWRLQYNSDFVSHRADDPEHAVFLQFEFLIGVHAAHAF